MIDRCDAEKRRPVRIVSSGKHGRLTFVGARKAKVLLPSGAYLTVPLTDLELVTLGQGEPVRVAWSTFEDIEAAAS